MNHSLTGRNRNLFLCVLAVCTGMGWMMVMGMVLLVMMMRMSQVISTISPCPLHHTQADSSHMCPLCPACSRMVRMIVGTHCFILTLAAQYGASLLCSFYV